MVTTIIVKEFDKLISNGPAILGVGCCFVSFDTMSTCLKKKHELTRDILIIIWIF